MVEFFSNSAHLHVLLNHVPTIGFAGGLALFLVALARRNDSLKRTGLAIFFIVANVGIATYVTGNGAEAVLKGRPDVSLVAIRAHEDAALLAFVFMEITGFFAWLALWQWRRVLRLAGWNVVVVGLLALVTFGLMAKAATLGGEISHAEIRTGEPVAATVTITSTPTGTTTAATETKTPTVAAPGGTARSIGLFVTGSTWVWPTCETLHFVGLCMLFTVVLVVDLRMLGLMKGVSFAAVYQLLPIGILGFGINLVTGMMFFIGAPGQYVHNGTFFFKIVFVVLGGLNVLYFTLDDEPWAVKAGDEAPFTAKMAAASAIFVWVAVLFCGHMLPFIGNAF